MSSACWCSAAGGSLSAALLLLALCSSSWLHVQEFSPEYAKSSLRIGLWEVCPENVSSINTLLISSDSSCTLIRYNQWEDLNITLISEWKNLEFAPVFVSRMRMCAPFSCLGLLLLVAATACTMAGLCKQGSLLIACGLYVLAGILIGEGLLVFASVLSDAYYERPSDAGATLHYNYGWAFFSAAAALSTAQLAAICSITAYSSKFRCVEDMVLVMVPGAERRLLAGPRPPDLCEPPPRSAPRPAARYAAPPRPPPNFYSLPRQSHTDFCSKSAV